MKKKLLFLGFLIGIFAALMILPASAETECVVCLASYEQIEEYHCEERCSCTYVTCPACGEDTLLMYCSTLHDFNVTYGVSGGIFITCKSCDLPKFDVSEDPRYKDYHSQSSWTTVPAKCTSRGYQIKACTGYTGNCRCIFLYPRSAFSSATGHDLHIEEKEAVCGTDGYTLYSCDQCDM